METRELYKQKYQAQIHEWTAKMDVLKAQGEKMTAQAKLDAKPGLDSLHSKLEIAKAKMHEIATATDEKWDEVKKSADHAWTDAKAAIEGAFDAVKTAGNGASTTDPTKKVATPAATTPIAKA